MKITRKRITASASGTVYAPIIGRDFEWFKSDAERYVGKSAESIRRFLKENDFREDSKMTVPHIINGTAQMAEMWTLTTDAGSIEITFYYDASSREYGKVLRVFVEDKQDPKLIADEESRLFSSTQIMADAADVGEYDDETSEEIYYSLSIEENPQGNYYETLDEAIDSATAYADDPAYADQEICVVLEHYLTNGRGEIIDWYDDNGDVVWSSNDSLYE